jgi:AGCS family alanine or glycine:cation symporter
LANLSNTSTNRACFALGIAVLIVLANAIASPTAASATEQASTESATVHKRSSETFDDETGKASTPPMSEWIQGKIDQGFGVVVEYVNAFLFFGVPTGIPDQEIPFILLVLILGGVFFTIRYGFINLRLFGHSIQVILGRYDHPEDEGEISHFQALTSALSATVGLGNIAGVALAIAMGGPGALFWMWLIAFFGMCSKFSSCSFAQLYRRVNPDGTVLGGPMIYLEQGIKDRMPSIAPLGKIFGCAFAVFTILGACGAGNMFQGNQTFAIISNQLDGVDDSYAWIFGLVLAFLVGLVILGGIRRIGEVTSRLVPLMCVFYCSVCLILIAVNIQKLPIVFASIFANAFSFQAGAAGFLGILIVGARRAAFSNEAGLGSAAIAHAAAKTKEPVREGVVAMIGPFIDTIVVCTMTAMAILISLDEPTRQAAVDSESKLVGIELTAQAFATLGSMMPILLCVAVLVFAYSTMISWCYYGERATEYLFGRPGIPIYRVVFLIFVVLGPILSIGKVLDFSDAMLFCMAFPNIIGMVMLSGILVPLAKDYIRRLKSGEMKPVKK